MIIKYQVYDPVVQTGPLRSENIYDKEEQAEHAIELKIERANRTPRPRGGTGMGGTWAVRKVYLTNLEWEALQPGVTL